MNCQVVVRGVEDGEGSHLRQFVLDKLERLIERYDHTVLDTTVRIEDITGPDKGGVDKLCKVDVKLRTGEVRIKEVGDDFKSTINAALDRLRSALSREVAKAKHGIGEG